MQDVGLSMRLRRCMICTLYVYKNVLFICDVDVTLINASIEISDANASAALRYFLYRSYLFVL